MIFKRKDVIDHLKSVLRILNIAKTKIQIAHDLTTNPKVKDRVFREATLASAMAGLPILPEFMAGAYISSTISDIKKARKAVMKLNKELSKKYKGIHEVYFDKNLKSVIELLYQIEEKLKSKEANVIEILRSIEEAYTILSSILLQLENIV